MPFIRSRARPGRPPRRWRGALAGAVLALGSALAPAAETSSWRDIESRIQYGYYTENALALRNLSEAVAAGAAHDKLRGYYAGLLAWRLALLAEHNSAAAPGISASQMAQRCVSELDAALAVEADFADALALRSACLETPSTGGGIFAPVTSYRARRDLDKARELDARNPRVLLVDAMSDYEQGACARQAPPGGSRLRSRAPWSRAFAGLGCSGGMAAAGAGPAGSRRPDGRTRRTRARAAHRARVCAGAAADAENNLRLKRRGRRRR
jgi:hypothetical protein